MTPGDTSITSRRALTKASWSRARRRLRGPHFTEAGVDSGVGGDHGPGSCWALAWS